MGQCERHSLHLYIRLRLAGYSNQDFRDRKTLPFIQRMRIILRKYEDWGLKGNVIKRISQCDTWTFHAEASSPANLTSNIYDRRTFSFLNVCHKVDQTPELQDLFLQFQHRSLLFARFSTCVVFHHVEHRVTTFEVLYFVYSKKKNHLMATTQVEKMNRLLSVLSTCVLD